MLSVLGNRWLNRDAAFVDQIGDGCRRNDSDYSMRTDSQTDSQINGADAWDLEAFAENLGNHFEERKWKRKTQYI